MFKFSHASKVMIGIVGHTGKRMILDFKTAIIDQN